MQHLPADMLAVALHIIQAPMAGVPASQLAVAVSVPAAASPVDAGRPRQLPTIE